MTLKGLFLNCDFAVIFGLFSNKHGVYTTVRFVLELLVVVEWLWEIAITFIFNELNVNT